MNPEDAWDWDYATDPDEGMDLKHAAILLTALFLSGGWLWVQQEPELNEIVVVLQHEGPSLRNGPMREDFSPQAWDESGI